MLERSFPFGSLVVCSALWIGSAAIAADLDQSDLTGTWSRYTRSDAPRMTPAGPNAPAYSYGSVTLDAAGNVTGGSETDHTGFSTTHTGGSYALNASCLVDGSIANAGGTDSFSDHQLDPLGTLLVGVDTNPDGSVAIESSVKRGGVFASDDVEGRWWYLAHWDQPGSFNAVGYDALQIVIDSGGIVRSVAGGTTSPPAVFLVDSTQFTIDSTGAVDIVTLSQAHLQMAPNKQVMMGVVTGANGYVVSVTLVRDDGSGFTSADLEGYWRFYSFFDRSPAEPSANYLKGILHLDDTGSLVSGSYELPGFGHFELSSGGFGITSGGIVGGQFAVAGSGTLVFGNVYMNAAGGFGAGAYRNGTNQVLTYLVVPEPTPGLTSLAALGTLCALRERRRARSTQSPGVRTR